MKCVFTMESDTVRDALAIQGLLIRAGHEFEVKVRESEGETPTFGEMEMKALRDSASIKTQVSESLPTSEPRWDQTRVLRSKVLKTPYISMHRMSIDLGVDRYKLRDELRAGNYEYLLGCRGVDRFLDLLDSDLPFEQYKAVKPRRIFPITLIPEIARKFNVTADPIYEEIRQKVLNPSADAAAGQRNAVAQRWDIQVNKMISASGWYTCDSPKAIRFEKEFKAYEELMKTGTVTMTGGYIAGPRT